MIDAVAMVMPRMLDSPLKTWVDSKAIQRGICIRWLNVAVSASSYCDEVRRCKNVIAWNCRVPQSWMKANGRNLLFIENSLICQAAGIFVDCGGFFSRSRLCTEKTWRNSQSYALEWVTKKWFGWDWGMRGDPAGPVLVALQNRHDCNLHTEFPLANDEPDKVVATLKLVARYLPQNCPVLIRPHPSERKQFNTHGVWMPHWELDVHGSFAERLPACRSVVTVNSTCANEATLTEIPVIVLGTGAFTGSGAVQECHRDASFLSKAFERPDMDARRSYASAVLARHFLPYDLRVERSCEEFEHWLNACRE